MTGAKELAELMGSDRYEKLEWVSNTHARGETFHIYILGNNGRRTVEVYGITGGQPGWTETYGWLHVGPWIADFEKIVQSKKLEREALIQRIRATTKELQDIENLRIQTLLREYSEPDNTKTEG